ncbi:N-acetylmuramoyl-L-alanine amidase [Acrocarpospora phusangensis]|uniref:N-acetylmuramoyl-L-alanine amidase n=1 Tax=Acrocarpospora phusangensis TaxID=1070424 RepID=A0A919USW7_9ACTN|nr:peptidoglycan recognition family protein [Acrocarpospora phusangensis]GIH29103.1 N-acetylmuramoyl-L-alanine amidase [Acrocarpospora phusangensis]
MPWLTQLAKVAKRTDYPVVEVPGWRTRGHGPVIAVRGIVCHHTAGPAGSGDYPSLGVVRNGRKDLAGPLSQYGLGRSGRIYVIAAGRAWHNAPTTSANHGNALSIGIEAENDGSQPWPAVQVDAYHQLVAELCREFELPAAAAKGHREVNASKPDPHSISMGAFRTAVARLLAEGEAGEPLPMRDGFPLFQRDLRQTSPPKPLMEGADVGAWQEAARRHVRGLAVDELYGPRSAAACRQIQIAAGIPATAVVDEETWVVTHVWNPRED